jgi:iron complex transport system ATP-binding protein
MILDVEGVEFSYDSIPILREVKFGIEAGELVSILGPNGAGKSTLLKCINRILKPRKGTIMIEGVPAELFGKNEIAKKIGYVPQINEANFMTVFDAVLLGRKPYISWGASEEDYKIVEETLRLMGIEKFSLRRTNELSGGELQKVALARALVQKPSILLLDEPTNNLDIKNQIEVMEVVRKIVHEEGISSIIVMHEINLAIRYCDKFIVMKDGIIYSQGERTISPQIIKEVYGVEAVVEEVKGIPLIVPLG